MIRKIQSNPPLHRTTVDTTHIKITHWEAKCQDFHKKFPFSANCSFRKHDNRPCNARIKKDTKVSKGD